ncbi:MAG: PKD domain-containing protein, partial [Chitinophagales bacterium]
PVHLYSSANSYTVKYSVITDIGCLSDTVKKTVAISVPPLANFAVSSPACEDKVLTFTDQSSAASGPSITKWTWNFGDGSPQVVATNGNVQPHTYISFGTNTASLLVETASGCKSLLSTKQIAINPNPFANFNFSNACLPAGTSNFTDQSSITTGNISQWLWDFGDGTTSIQQNPVHNYTSTGPFNVRLTVTSANGCSDDSVRIMDKVYAQPSAAFAAPAEVCFGSVVNFTDQSITPNSTIKQWLWNFGDGTTSTQQNPTKIYSTPGTYVVTLMINSAAGCSSSIVTKNIIVDPLPAANFNLSLPNCINQNIIFTDASAANTGNIVKWTWDFGDGNNSVLNSNNPLSHSYTATGSYNSTLKVETNKGCISTIFSKQVNINPLPLADFVLPESCLNDPFSLFIDSSSIADGTQNLFSHQWDFGDPNANPGDPNTSTIKDPQHRYTATGSYHVTETITSNNGCISSNTKTFFVNGSVPVPSFSLQENTTVCSGDSIHLSDHSAVDPGNVIKLEIYWDYTNDPTIKTIDDFPSPGKIYVHSYPEFNSPVTKIVTVRYVAYSGQTCVQYIDKAITLMAAPALQFNPIQGICKNVPAFQLTQAVISNGLPGSGIFSGQGVSPNGLFNPSSAAEGTDTIRYTYNADNGCTNFIDQTIEVFPVPVANAGPDQVVLQGGEITLTPNVKVNYPVTYTWTPSTWLDNAEIETPKSKPLDDITYMLTVRSDKGCASSDNVFVKVLKTPQIPNIFSPNNDGIHDRWEIPYLSSYPGCTVEVYNRYGQLIFHSVGYDKSWDGTVSGNPVPVGTYYYIIDPKNGRQKMSGYVDVIR